MLQQAKIMGLKFQKYGPRTAKVYDLSAFDSIESVDNKFKR